MNSFTPSSSRTAPLNKDITPSFVILLHVPRFALIWVSLGDKGNSSKVKVERTEKRKSINTYGSLMSIGKWYWIGNMWTTDSSKTLSRWMKIEKTKKVENLLKKNSVKVFLLCIRHFLFSLFFFFVIISEISSPASKVSNSGSETFSSDSYYFHLSPPFWQK